VRSYIGYGSLAELPDSMQAHHDAADCRALQLWRRQHPVKIVGVSKKKSFASWPEMQLVTSSSAANTPRPPTRTVKNARTRTRKRRAPAAVESASSQSQDENYEDDEEDVSDFEAADDEEDEEDEEDVSDFEAAELEAPEAMDIEKMDQPSSYNDVMESQPTSPPGSDDPPGHSSDVEVVHPSAQEMPQANNTPANALASTQSAPTKATTDQPMDLNDGGHAGHGTAHDAANGEFEGADDTSGKTAEVGLAGHEPVTQRLYFDLTQPSKSDLRHGRCTSLLCGLRLRTHVEHRPS
jgi:hypothetical protein